MDRKRLALIAAILGSFVAGLDSTVVNVALPSIKDDLGGGLAGQQWISNAYLLTLGSLILIGGSLGDLFGERRIFSIGVGGFGAASLICAIAPSVELLVAARALQGVFGALLTPSALAVIIAAYPPAERGSAIGSWTAWTGIAFVVGPLAGGVLVDATSWRWIFLINLPFVALTLFVVAAAVEARPRPDHRPHVDITGAVLCALGLGGPVYALTRQPDAGWGSPEVVLPLLAGLALFAAFLGWERRSPGPMLPLALFKRRNFAVGNLQTVAMYGGLSLNLFTVVLFLQQVAGYSALQSGLATMPTTIVMFTLSKRMGALADRFGPRLFMGGGPILAACGLLLYERVSHDAHYVSEVLPALVVFSLGLSMTVAPLTATVLADADDSNAGIASGINNALARMAGLLAVAALGIIVSGAVTLGSFHRVMGIAAGLVALGGVLGLAGIVNPPRTCAETLERHRVPAMTELVLTEDAGHVRHIVLNRPEKRNAFNSELIDALADAVRATAGAPDVHVVVLRGNGPMFSSGVDLKELAGQLDGGSGLALLRTFRTAWLDAANALEELAKPVVCQIQGGCIGGALETALACDLRVMADDAVIGLPETRIGLIPDVGGSSRLPQVVGLGRAKELILTGALIGADRAEAIGLVNRVAPAAELEAATQQLVDELLVCAPIAVGLAKRVIDASARPALSTTLELEIALQTVCAATEDFATGARAFAAKQQPVFQGR